MKLLNFPSVNYTSLRESVDRREYMQSQLKYLGIERSSVYITDRFTELTDIKITGQFAHEVEAQFGVIVSHLNLMRNWYNSCNEPYAIFCEDDISFESVNYWNFTWYEFMANLPKDWECVQLMRMVSPWYEGVEDVLKINLKLGRAWGSNSLMSREYVRRLLEKTCKGFNEYHLEVWVGESAISPIIENLLFLGNGTVYNIPFLIEDFKFGTTYKNKPANADDDQMRSHISILNEWKTKGHTLDIKDIMRLE